MVPIALALALAVSADLAPGASAAAAAAAPRPKTAAPQAATAKVEPAGELPTLRFGELVEAGPTGLGPSPRARALAGARIRLVGYMVHSGEEQPEIGAFWLAPRPMRSDESGAGTGDLPPEAVRVVVRDRAAGPSEHIEGPIAVTGVLEVGNQADEEGRVSAFRLLLDAPPPSASHSPKK